MRKYSRLLTVEEKRNRRKAVFYVFLTIILFLIFIFFGISSLAKLSSFIGGFQENNATVDNDELPPSKPRFLTTVVATNSATLLITGSSEPKVEIIISQNGKELERVLANDQGLFERKIVLLEGENQFIALARDQEENKSQNSDPIYITFDNTAPEISITEPQVYQFNGEKEQTITIKGKISEEAQILINDRIVPLGEEYNFSISIKLSNGENKFIIKAIDRAGNRTEKELLLNFTS